MTLGQAIGRDDIVRIHAGVQKQIGKAVTLRQLQFELKQAGELRSRGRRSRWRMEEGRRLRGDRREGRNEHDDADKSGSAGLLAAEAELAHVIAELGRRIIHSCDNAAAA
jgi:hypothetical protein